MREKMRRNGRKLIFFALLFVAVSAALPAPKEVQAAAAGFRTVKGKTYYIKKDGAKQKGWLTLKGRKYYFDLKTGVQQKGWQKDKSGNYQRYFTNGSGYMVTGFLKNGNGHSRYFNRKTGLMTRGWLTLSGKKYYFSSSSGIMKTSWVNVPNGKKRYFSKTDGHMFTGWIHNSKKQYRYFEERTGYMVTGFQKLGSYYYYFPASGVRFQEGFRKISGKTYYFTRKNGRAQTGWLELNGKKYYFSKYGVMYANTSITVGGKKYTVDSAGVCTESKANISGSVVTYYDSVNKRSYRLAKEYVQHKGIESGAVTDLDLLAALVDAEANDQGEVGMEAVAMCILNRTIKADREFPSQLREVIYQLIPGSTYPQYSVVRDGALQRRLNGQFEERTAAYSAAKKALALFKNHVTKKTPRTLPGFKRKDFNYMYFMMESSFWSQSLNFAKVEKELYRDHMFFVDWV